MHSSRLELIIDYIEQFDPAAAKRSGERPLDAADSLAVFPNRGRPAMGDRRELVAVRPYIIRDRVEDQRIVILNRRHMAQLPDPD